MKGFWNAIFQFDSPFMLKTSRVVCLILLNVLWFLLCLPVITIGPATTAMYYVLFQYRTEKSDSVVRPFFKAFRRDFLQSLLLGLPLTIVWGLLAFNGLYILSLPGGFQPLWIPFFLLLSMAGALSVYGFPMIARYRCRLRDIVHNSLTFFLQNILASLRMLLLQMMPVLLVLFLPEFFIKTSFFWPVIGISLIAYINTATLLNLFRAQEEPPAN